MKLTAKEFIQKLLLFFLILLVLFVLWLPFSGPYLWLRLKISYLMLNMVGFYPKFTSPTSSFWMGELFSFLPFLALMITTYKKQTAKHYPYILCVMAVLIFVEIIGRFFSELSFFYPKSIFVGPIAIFLLATARPALPFIFWFFQITKGSIKNN